MFSAVACSCRRTNCIPGHLKKKFVKGVEDGLPEEEDFLNYLQYDSFYKPSRSSIYGTISLTRCVYIQVGTVNRKSHSTDLNEESNTII